jgi:hypothetical protein
MVSAGIKRARKHSSCIYRNPAQAHAGHELDFVAFNWKSVFEAETLLAVIFQSSFSTLLSTSNGSYLNLNFIYQNLSKMLKPSRH